MGFREEREGYGDTLIHQQISQNMTELENKRKSLLETKLSLLKSNGRLNWEATKPSGVPTAGAPMTNSSFGGKV